MVRSLRTRRLLSIHFFWNGGAEMASRLRNRLFHVYALTLCAFLASVSASSGQIVSEPSDGMSAAESSGRDDLRPGLANRTCRR